MKRAAIDWQSVLGPLAGLGDGLSNDEILQLNRAAQSYSRRSIRIRPGVPDDSLPFATEPVPWFGRGRFLIDDGIRPGAYLNFAAGDYTIQDAGSLLPIALANIQPGQAVCDVCAAPGGKSTAIAEQLGGEGILVANEVIRSRLSILELALARCGYGNHLILNLEVEPLAALCGDCFDCVLVDAPCTGQSLVAKGKQTLSAFSPRQIEHSAARQRRILRSAANLVRPGGRLVYSTCTFSYQENEAIVQFLRDELPDWQPVNDVRLAAWASRSQGTYRLWPHRDQCAGGFAAALDRPTESADEQLNFSSRNQHFSTLNPHARRRCNPFKLADLDPTLFTAEHSPGEWIERTDGSVHRFAQGFATGWIEAAYAGVEIARLNAGIWSPSYPSATLDPAILSATRTIELNNAEAIRFIAGESLACTPGVAGWAIVRWQSRPLAWGKSSARTLKNHVPKQLRLTGIRCQVRGQALRNSELDR